MADAAPTDSTVQAAAALPAVAATTPEAVKAAEKAAVGVHKKVNTAAAPIRQYLASETTVVPVLMQGMQAMCKERPDNPVEYLAYYLLAHNPQPNSKPVPKAAEAQAGSPAKAEGQADGA
ncbi:hypothetical protein GPECTOR_61g798 [Gonium pectorale]|uniref:Uncharacterized protein n=1 Tax=Gonium pectorale TaxID=33097 RepID=A0A150G5N1_GONPE|nr:hypothetical protein GPECTOR_61g798 [Gonium pectorale]|eukprot:KXZ44845.1 hypothetical protein GPECTOR_61g798 [Gonium pectorale]